MTEIRKEFGFGSTVGQKLDLLCVLVDSGDDS